MITNNETESKERVAGGYLAEAMLRYERGTLPLRSLARLIGPATQHPKVAVFALEAYEKREPQTLADAFCKRRKDIQEKIESRTLNREDFEREVLFALNNHCCQNDNEQKYLWELWQEHKKTPYTNESSYFSQKAKKPYIAMNLLEKAWDNLKFLPYLIFW